MPRALITGGAGGIGGAAVTAFGDAGYQVGVVDRIRPEGLASEVIFAEADVSDEAAVQAAFATIVDQLGGPLDAVVNAAGVQLAGASQDMALEDWNRVLEINLTGTFIGCRAARAHLAGGGGAIVNIGSVAAHVGMPARAPYGVSKAGVVALTRILAAEWGADGVRVVCVSPGYTRTPMVQDALDAGRIAAEPILARTALGRLAEPREIADACVWVAGPAASFISGTEILVDGGWLSTGLRPEKA